MLLWNQDAGMLTSRWRADGKYTSPNGNNKADFSSVAAPTPGASNTGHC